MFAEKHASQRKLAVPTELAASNAKDIFKMCPVFLFSPIGGDLECTMKDEEAKHIFVSSTVDGS
jgi:hypothetical protein